MSSQSVDTGQATDAEVVVKGRNVEVPDHFRVHVSERLGRLAKYDDSIYLFDVELHHEPNRRQRKSSQHVDITARGRGPVVLVWKRGRQLPRAARQLERAIKALPRRDKERLVAGDEALWRRLRRSAITPA